MPRLTRIVLDNFLSFGHIEFDLCGKDGPRGYALIYGENGSGKTNLVKAVRFLTDSIGTIVMADAIDAYRADLEKGGPRQFPNDPDRQDIENAMYHLVKSVFAPKPVSLTTMGRSCRMIGSDGPMHLRYDFDTDTGRLSYTMEFSVDGTLATEELARFTTGTRTSRLFRVESGATGPEASFGRSVFAPELSRALRRRIPVSWGKNSLLAILTSEFSRNNDLFMQGSVSEHVKATLDFIRSVSVDVDSGTFRDVWENGMPMEQGMVDPSQKGLLDAYGRAASSYLVRLYSDVKRVYYETVPKDDGLEYRLVVEKVIAGERREIPFDQESSGTRKLLGMLPALLRCVRGGIAFVDEFDSGIHDKIVHDMLDEIFRESAGQLILTTHNTLLLETAEPSNVYVIRSTVDGFKEIRTFDSIAHTKKGHHNNRLRYLQGLYDGVPIIRSLDLPAIAERLGRDLERTS